MDGCNWTYELTQCLEKGMTASACLKETVPLKVLDHCKWSPEKMMVQLKCICQIHLIYAIYGCKCSSEK